MRKYNHAWLASAWRQLIIAGALLMASLIGLPMQAQAVGSTQLINLTNNERTKNGLAPLAYNGRLASSAYAKAQDMIAKGYWAHTSPDGTSPWTFVQRAGYSYVTVGENLARDFSTDSATMSGWMNSPGHRANILKPEYRDIGIAVVSGVMNGETTLLVVAHYGATSTAPAARPSQSAPKQTTTKPKVSAQPKAQPAPQVASAVTPVPEQTKPATKSPLELFLASLLSFTMTGPLDILRL